VSGHPRFTFGVVDLMGGINFIAAMIGMFAVAEVIRTVTAVGRNPRRSCRSASATSSRGWAACSTATR
jgi:putative tricarboxylic transport membrane protein